MVPGKYFFTQKNKKSYRANPEKIKKLSGKFLNILNKL